MVKPDECLRESINGGRLTVPEPRRLSPIREAGDLGTRASLRLGIGAGAVASLVGVLAAVWLVFGASEGPSPTVGAPPDTAVVSKLTRITTLEPAAIMSDSAIFRGPAPTGLNGRPAPVPDDLQENSTRSPAPLRTVSLDDPGRESDVLPIGFDDAVMPMEGAAPGLPGSAQDPEAGEPVAMVSRPAALVLAQSNLGWSRIFAAEGLAYMPIDHAPLGAWDAGACAARSLPQGPTYCALDRTVYLDPTAPTDRLGMLEIAHQIGRHVQDLLGVRLHPLSGDARDRQADCFAGMWASGAGSLAELAPGLVAREMSGGHGLYRWQRDRLAAFSLGYAASTIADCAEAEATALFAAD